MNFLNRYAAATWTPPFPQAIPSSVEDFVRSTSPWRAAKRRFVRELNLTWHGQRPLLREHIDPAVHRRVLWIHHGTPQVGDSLTDLAARTLLNGHVEQLDLLTDAHLVPLYRSDQVFNQAAADPADLSGRYDLVLLHSASSRSVKAKFSHYRQTPFAHVHGYYTGPEFNRTLFGYHRIAQLLGLQLSEAEVSRMACPSMWASAAEEAAVEALQIPFGSMAMAIGGVRDWCTYRHWPEVLAHLKRISLRRPIVLIGSENGMPMRDRLLQEFPEFYLIDRVARHSLGEVHALMRRCALVTCADGGLLHVAHTARVPVATLFANHSEPRFRLTAANQTRWLYGPKEVSDVPANALAALLVEMLELPPA